ncbi:beta-1,4-N-acetylgalactosaminyltransferase bre-4 [Bicyclus anynana]|uniref:Beta-1,4-N-acetylgalactosaminyltransferase n=1 Tax=Bicyclus anynana TaxID=110368 RepID=A0A6J1NFV8_BICAN|nr:beta-1,4-N-acetylgalactosaminyltransferase bre-4 [Bicyclus anynana]XP_023945844.2 beta-1,4-N-acetylgalactosaminyltransferase bre-4 [Bicyclus anynana]XP_023945845.2 beta-1,4-N-acetylgalactosaminyltransferase bre-4 [Bicyclus anynana]
MPKWLSRQRLFLLLKKNVWLLFPLISIVQFFFTFGEFKYEHIPVERVNDYLYKHVNPNLKLVNTKAECKYDDILHHTQLTQVREMKKMLNFTPKGIMNGSFAPEECNPAMSVAILVTYRNRQSQLDVFIPYIHTFLRKQNIHYKIYVIEQQDDKPWNKGLLYNIGAKQAIAEKFPCLILHDVDLLPLDHSNLYVCLNQPRHMSASIDKFRFVLIYNTLVGGVLAITSEHYKLLNGFSNRFLGWGGEDDDFASRISANKLDILRFPQHMARYTMLRHQQEPENSARYAIMLDGRRRAASDGLGSVAFASVGVRPQRLYTLITVRV